MSLILSSFTFLAFSFPSLSTALSPPHPFPTADKEEMIKFECHPFPSPNNLTNRSQETFSVKSQKVNIVTFRGHLISVKTAALCSYSAKSVRDNTGGRAY